ncbi:hypothetical protein U5801_20520 [Lamprobacter modestohalophilus]|uniref:hypothetical protein n=1 Tax=Lamprobacter modestohalophilus TaxID=1064514 RepID=UPI002ADED0A5|nr:hypothetical protein [Lamprobacter modestohalophilus]MEA1052173.1 hypothetical protein [Lamprobacter modestohalophilus]
MQAASFDKPLPLNFPQTFLPDRRLLGQLLAFAARNGSGDKEAIGAETGIPTGKSTGKVEPMIHYALGMGLASAMKSKGVWQLGLTPLGDCVVREDPLLGEPLSLWLLHLLLCRRCGHDVPAVGLADPWFALFAEGSISLGGQFTEAAFHRLLVQRHGNKSYLKGLSTLVPRMYTERACFGEAGILTAAPGDDEKALLRRARAPLEKGLFPAYALLLFLLWDARYSTDKQLAFDELARDTRLLALLGWDVTQATEWLDWMASRGLVQLDRYTGSVVLLRLAETPKVVAGLYSELI